MNITKLILVSALVSTTPLALVAAENFSKCQGCQMGATAAMGTDAVWLAQAKAAYPLKTCVVSGEELGGDMGDAIDYIYQQEGQPDRLLRFCCKMCVPKFKKDPSKFLKLIDDAATAKSK